MHSLRLIFGLFLIAAAFAVHAVNICKTQPCTNPCPPPVAQYSACPSCCENMGGINYCDSSAGRFVCNNGYYSSCYCSRHAVMDLQKIQGCCLWQGGVMAIDPAKGTVICNNGGISEVCSLQTTIDRVSVW
ncbi:MULTISPECIES: neurogenic locus notch [Legionella]|uniref:Neurogenic locus notch n=1 Tax=Legionella septentrionalis TaxID=2498109 RepID=A0A433JI47_9GAMM|nr:MULTISPECIES: neurogenic locus notch [Legionella]MCP0912916.1 neurogenic locus notch [Legionella sp. 27cVA30]RUQ84128.1 neurogenic locus notch [Legionella septentrionalis]RUQ95695.1 neurogenic locus notch [Legionella septentrionalis]RUR10108.1 neurogenic locus notch [Legionella septentrionalis]RUR15500.1 neurogenic locus notch [Legionella septentrionalis]